MRDNGLPLVSVVTPVYNGEAYLDDCIKSVLDQTYSNWEYIIVNNCSKDRTLEIAISYAEKDSRIRVVDSAEFRKVIANHNYAFSLISPQSKYTKVVSADDVVFPDCITQLVRRAEDHPSVGIVASYQLSGGDDEWVVRCNGLPYWQTTVSGKDICRRYLMKGQNLFGAPTSVIYRSDLVRANPEFYPNPRAEADVSCCIQQLLESDFGFVHQVLSFERCHGPRVSTTSRALSAYITSRLSDLRVYGPFCLEPEEEERRRNELLDDLYRNLAIAAANFRERDYWQYQKDRFNELGLQLDRSRLARAVCAKVFDLIINPRETFGKFRRRFGHGGSRPQIAMKGTGA